MTGPGRVQANERTKDKGDFMREGHRGATARRASRGAISTEMLGYLGVYAFLIIAAIGAVMMMMRDSKANGMKQELQMMNTKIHDMYQLESSYVSITTALVAQSPFMSKDAIGADGQTLRSPWGVMQVAPATDNTSNDTFSIELDTIDAKTCKQVGQVAGATDAWRSLAVNGNIYDNNNDNSSSPLVVFLNTNCTGSGDAITMTFVARR
jgi:hypothetical protein